MIIASAAALLATSDPNSYHRYIFEAASDGQRTTLTQSAPHARYLLRVRATALGPEEVDTTSGASATAHGTISTSAEGVSPFVRVRFGASGQASNTVSSDAVSALTTFQLSRPLRFTGNCSEPDQGTPCQAELDLSLELEQPSSLPADASVSIEWSVDLESTVSKVAEKDSDESLAAPWTIELFPLTEP